MDWQSHEFAEWRAATKMRRAFMVAGLVLVGAGCFCGSIIVYSTRNAQTPLTTPAIRVSINEAVAAVITDDELERAPTSSARSAATVYRKLLIAGTPVALGGNLAPLTEAICARLDKDAREEWMRNALELASLSATYGVPKELLGNTITLEETIAFNGEWRRAEAFEAVFNLSQDPNVRGDAMAMFLQEASATGGKRRLKLWRTDGMADFDTPLEITKLGDAHRSFIDPRTRVWPSIINRNPR